MSQKKCLRCYYPLIPRNIYFKNRTVTLLNPYGTLISRKTWKLTRSFWYNKDWYTRLTGGQDSLLWTLSGKPEFHKQAKWTHRSTILEKNPPKHYSLTLNPLWFLIQNLLRKTVWLKKCALYNDAKIWQIIRAVLEKSKKENLKIGHLIPFNPGIIFFS